MNALLKSRRLPLLLSFLIFFYSSCSSVRLITDYDEVTYASINAVQEKVTTFFVDWRQDMGTKKAKYENHKDFYRDMRVKTETLALRANAMDKNSIVIQQVQLLESNFKNLEDLDKAGVNSVEEILPLKNAFNSALTAMIKLQLGLKRGEK